MKHYRITEELRDEVNNYLGEEYIRSTELGGELVRLDHFETISKVHPDKAKLLMGTLFPELLNDQRFLTEHRDEIRQLSKNLHIREEERRPVRYFDWSYYAVRTPGVLPPGFDSGLEEENIFFRNLGRFD